MSDEEDYKEIDKELKALKSAIAKSKNNDLMKYKSIISNFIESEIVERYYYDSGRIEHEVFTDEDVKSAIDLLNSKADYDKILVIAE